MGCNRWPEIPPNWHFKESSHGPQDFFQNWHLMREIFRNRWPHGPGETNQAHSCGLCASPSWSLRPDSFSVLGLRNAGARDVKGYSGATLCHMANCRRAFLRPPRSPGQQDSPPRLSVRWGEGYTGRARTPALSYSIHWSLHWSLLLSCEALRTAGGKYKLALHFTSKCNGVLTCAEHWPSACSCQKKTTT